MWDVRERRENGQLILVGALSLAIVLVGIALVLNASIYAENLATRANQQESGQIVTLEREAAQGAGVAMEHLHHDLDSHTSYTDLESNFDDAIDNWSDWTVRDSAREGQYVDVSVVDTDPYTRGTRITQDDGGTFEPNESDAVLEIDLLSSLTGDLVVDYWSVTPGSSRVRDFSMTVDHDQLGNEGGSLLQLEVGVVGDYLADLRLDGGTNLELVDSLSLDGAPFTAVYDVGDDGDIDYSFAIYPSDDDPDDVRVTSRNYDTGVTRTCTIENVDSTFTVDVSNGRVEGADGACSDVFAFQSRISDPYQLIFVEGDQIGGDYELVVDEPTDTFDDDYDALDLLDVSLLGLSDPTFDDFYQSHPDPSAHTSPYSTESPYIEPALYDATVSLDYQSDSMSYESTVTVAPNEP
ncbi:DUF7261 family protein [Haloglomus halophilum]|uniref:DUF7261 family protein n=1 Tax=Haloglomus halophilum TaxID=2962672 RepID=UPI0020C9A4AC|nr:hypothetical protein [Haloglomus halophilum]